MWEKLEHALLHGLKDTAPLLLFIFLIYALIELLESKADLKKNNRFGGKLGPLLGSATGLIPQCGFSVMAAKLFEQKYITVGTLLAIFMATSDEAFIVMLSSGEGAFWVVPMLFVKVLVGTMVGYGADFILKAIGRGQVCVEMPETVNGTPTTTREIFIQRYQEERDVETSCSCGRDHSGESAWKKYLLYPLLHMLKVGAFIFLVNFILSFVIEMVGEDKLAAFMDNNLFLQPIIACAIGLIPNCASSVVITETFLGGAITFGSCVAGLCANAGMGFIVLLRNVRQWKRNITLIVVCYVVSALVGLALNLFPLYV
jgi:hypothetical protein